MRRTPEAGVARGAGAARAGAVGGRGVFFLSFFWGGGGKWGEGRLSSFSRSRGCPPTVSAVA